MLNSNDLMEIYTFIHSLKDDGNVLNKHHFDTVMKMSDLHSRKNSDYGNSFDKSLDKRGIQAFTIRAEDKLNRIDILGDKDYEQLIHDESLKDSVIDLANYAIMTAMWLELEEETSKVMESSKHNVATDWTTAPKDEPQEDYRWDGVMVDDNVTHERVDNHRFNVLLDTIQHELPGDYPVTTVGKEYVEFFISDRVLRTAHRDRGFVQTAEMIMDVVGYTLVEIVDVVYSGQHDDGSYILTFGGYGNKEPKEDDVMGTVLPANTEMEIDGSAIKFYEILADYTWPPAEEFVKDVESSEYPYLGGDLCAEIRTRLKKMRTDYSKLAYE